MSIWTFVVCLTLSLGVLKGASAQDSGAEEQTSRAEKDEVLDLPLNSVGSEEEMLRGQGDPGEGVLNVGTLGEGDAPEDLNEEGGAIYPEVPLVEQEYLVIRYSEDISDVIPDYKNRRESWGSIFGAAVSLFSPSSYAPNFASAFDFEGLYGGQGVLFEFTASAKWNFSLGALSGGLGAGFFSASSRSNEVDESTLTLIPVRLEVSLILDNYLNEPFVAPYLTVGAYTIFFKEEQSSVSFNGNTQVAPYFAVGANIQLDWLEPRAAVSSYIDYGLENTFLYIEGRQFIESSAAADPNFGTSLQLAAGARFEY